MANVVGASRSPLEGLVQPGRHGRSRGEPGVVITEMSNIALASVIARKGKVKFASEAAKHSFGCKLPHTPRRVEGKSIEFLWSGPRQWLALARSGYKPSEFGAALNVIFLDLALIAEQSDGRCILQICGPRARDVLAKGLSIDLHSRAFHTDDTAVTVGALIGVQIWQLDDTPTYEIAVFRSFARSFWRFLSEAAAEYGYDVAGASTVRPRRHPIAGQGGVAGS
jgi:heterotetrameric sarcosine oxidase gamma subunit